MAILLWIFSFPAQYRVTAFHNAGRLSARVLVLALDDGQHLLPDLTGLLASINALPDAALLVVVDDGRGLLVVGNETLLEGIGVVIAALDKRLAGDVVGHGLLGRVEGRVVRAARGGMDQAAGNAFNQKRVVDLELNNVLEGLVALLQHGVETLSLRNRSGETVENETALAVSRKIPCLHLGYLVCNLTRPGTPYWSRAQP